MIRCQRCGLRVQDAHPVCPRHGPVQSPSLAADPAADALRDLPPPAAFAALGFDVSRLLGRGGFGAVFAAVRLHDKRPVALKVALRDQQDAAESLARETMALRTVGPPHVPEVYESGTVDGLPYVALEHITAPTVAERMVAQGGPLPLDVFGIFARAIMQPLAAIHERGIVHRDLKPENIFLDDAGQARIIDFGLARDSRSRAELLEATQMANDDVGTAEYMSPEQCDGISDADPRSDIYSLGVLFYEFLSGAPPFWGLAADVREAHRSRRPVPLSLKFACPADLDQLIRRCLAKERERRFDSIAELAQTLEGVLFAHGASVRPGQQLTGPRSRAPSSPRPAAPPREKRAVGLVFFESGSGLGNVQSVVTSSGGQLVQTNGSQYVAAFAHDVGDNPARIALVAAHRLLSTKLAERLLVDVAQVSVQSRPDGSRRIFSPVFSKKDRFPSPGDAPGVLLTAAASEVIPDLQTVPLPGRPDRFTLPLQQFANESTTFGIQLTPLLGRDDALRSLLDSARNALMSAEPALITVLAEPGFGRTHLYGVAAQRIERELPSVELIRLSAQEGVVRAASQVLPELLRRVLELPRTAPAEDSGKALLLERLGDMAEGAWAAAAHALGWIDAEHPEVRRLAAAPGALRLASARAGGEALRRRARQRPLALLLDDAHLADEPTLDALEYATLRDAPVPIWVCVLARTSFESSRPAWGSRAALTRKISLPPLALKDAVNLARSLLLPAEYIPEAVLIRLAERTQGVPRLLVELARGLKRDGYVRRAERGSSYYLAIDELDKLPDLPIVQWNAIREVEALPPQLAGHARLASVLGANFSIAEVEALLQILERDELPEDMQLDAAVGVQRLVDVGILLRRRTGLIDFRHALLRDTIYQQVPDAQKKRLHRAAFEAYRALTMRDDDRLPRLAMHAARCGEREVAASTYLAIAQRYTRIQAYLEAEAAFGSALDNLDDADERTIAAARGRGLMRSRLGRQEGALHDLRKARERAALRGDKTGEIELMLDEATVLDWTRDMNQSAGLVRTVQAQSAAGQALSPLLDARLTLGLARSHHRQGEAEATIRVGSVAVQKAEQLGDDGYETRIIAQLMVATDCATSGDLEQAEHGFERVIAEAESRGDLWHVAAALGNRAVLWHGRKNLERLFADLERTAQLGREIGEASMEFLAVSNIGESEYALGRLDRAASATQRALELAKQLFGENNHEVSTSELLLARIALYGDDIVAAREYVDHIKERSDRARAAGDSETDMSPSNQLLLDMVDLASTGASVDAWDHLISRSAAVGMQPNEEVELLELAAIAATRLGARVAARRLYEQALDVSHAKPNLMSERVVRKVAPLLQA